MAEKTEKLKIANIVCAFPPYKGGIPNSAKQIAELLSDKFEVENFHPDNLKPWFRRGHGAFAPSLFFKLRKFDYIYLHYPFFGTAEVVWFFKLLYKKPKLIIHYHMDVKNLKFAEKLLSLPSNLILKSLLKKAELIVSASFDYLKNSKIKNYYHLRPDKFKEIPFAIDLEKFKPKEIKQEGGQGLIAKAKSFINFVNNRFIKKDKVEFIFVGGLDSAHYFKGLENLIKALSFSPGNWSLNIVGDGDLRKKYEEDVYKVGLEKKIIFRGKLSDDELIRAYQEADCLVLPSINNNEAFGIVLIEAMACGLALIASDLPGVRSVFENEREGLLVKTDDVISLKEALERIINDRGLRKSMSLAARELTTRKYSEDKMKERLERLFN
jgi:glycosyltransferase involved in cell wall biosynthesis